MLYDPTAVSQVDLLIAAHEAGEMYKASLLKQFANVGEDVHDYVTTLRGSALGKPIVEIFARRFYPELFTNNTWKTNQQLQLFHEGDTFEADAYFHLVRTGVKVLAKQVDCNWMGVTGHIDFIVEIDGQPTILELKSAKNDYFKSVLKKSIVDEDRGYVTQLAVYMEANNLPGKWIVYDKDNSAHTIITPTLTDVEIALKRARLIVKLWEEVTCFEDIFEFVRPPKPLRPEKVSGKNTGRHYPPLSLWNSPVLDLVYICEDGYTLKDEPCKYILDYRYPEKWMHKKPPLR